MTILLALLYPLAIQYERGGWWSILKPLALVTAIIDVIANYTELAILTLDFPQAGELTFSVRCNRLIHQDNWAGKVGRFTQIYCNFFDEGHIK
jgi:hypothetical protein